GVAGQVTFRISDVTINGHLSLIRRNEPLDLAAFTGLESDLDSLRAGHHQLPDRRIRPDQIAGHLVVFQRGERDRLLAVAPRGTTQDATPRIVVGDLFLPGLDDPLPTIQPADKRPVTTERPLHL